ncbi:hypothetical protein ABTW96_24350 [Nocardia beijingensis]|uniref:hypothetical protein n=1 Tax=Nocardia beijingensis TaxID=95162 RepID=UPI00332216E5
MNIADSSTPSGHYWTVPLELPNGASPKLTDYVIKAKTMLQKMVDMLGSPKLAKPLPIPKQPPPVLVQDPDGRNGSGVMMASYTTKRESLDDESAALQDIHADIGDRIGRVADINATALQAIQKRIIDLNSVLHAAVASETMSASFRQAGRSAGPHCPRPRRRRSPSTYSRLCCTPKIGSTTQCGQPG